MKSVIIISWTVQILLAISYLFLSSVFALAETVGDCGSGIRAARTLFVTHEKQCRIARIKAKNKNIALNSEEVELALLSLIRDGSESVSIILNDVTIRGDIDLSNLKIEKYLDFRNVTLTGSLDMSSSSSTLPIAMNGARINGAFLLKNAKFQALFAPGIHVGDNFVANGLTLNGQLYLARSTFLANVSLWSSRIGGHLLLNDAKISGALELSSTRVGGQIYLDRATIDGVVDLRSAEIAEMLLARRLRTPGEFNAQEVTVGGQIDISGTHATIVTIESARVGGNVLMREVKASRIEAQHLRTEGQIDIEDALISQEIEFEETSIGSNLLARGVQSEAIDLRGADINDQLDLSGSRFGTIRMSEVSIGANFLAKKLSVDGSFDANGVEIGGQMTFIGVNLNGNLFLENSNISDNVFLRDSLFYGLVSFVYANVRGGLDLSASTFSHLALAGTKVEGELRFGSDITKPWSWVGTSILDVRGVHVGGIDDFPSEWVQIDAVWPDTFLVDGFRFDRLTSSFSDPIERDRNWHDNFLSRMNYSPQTYDHFSDYFEDIGEKSLASDIRYLSADRFREESVGVKFKIFMFLSKIFVGYGEKLYFAIYWALGIIIIGIIVLIRHFDIDRCHSKLDYFFYSFDRFIPFIEIDKKLGDEISLTGVVRYYFYFHSIMGYVVGVFVAAAIAGLAK